MATTNSVTGTNAADALTSTQGTTATRNTGGTLGKDDFLKLLVGQMKNMDPMGSGGSDPSQMMSQMTQYSILEQITNMTASNKALAEQSERSSTIGLIGRTVSYANEAGAPVEGVVEQVTTAAGSVTLTIGGTAGIDPDKVLEVR
jgi:flagellar basal-body rod modification protein FlgD